MVDTDDDTGDDSPDGASRALTARRPPPSRLPAARSLADAAPGEMVYVDRHGQSLSPRQVRAMYAASWAFMLAGGGLVGVVYGVLVSPTVGVIAAVTVELLTLLRMRHWPALRAALAHVAVQQWEQAHAALLALEGRRLPAGQRQTVQVILAGVEALLGQPQQAVDRLDRVRPLLAAWSGYGSRLLRCQAASVRAGALTTLGRFEDARRARDELAGAATRTADRQRGDYLDMIIQSTDLQIASEADTPDALPDDDTLHRWARAALGRTRFGELLVSLAWAFQRRGDDDMARPLLSEAPSRIPRWSLDVTSPRLDAWAKDRFRAWGIEAWSPGMVEELGMPRS
jgi:hypothetical protein